MIRELNREERLQIMRFVCAFAWADLEIHPTERSLVQRFAQALDMPEEEIGIVDTWLKRPPRPEEIDPYDIPSDLRETVLAAAHAMCVTDGDFEEKESELLALLKSLFDEDDDEEDSDSE